MASTPSLSEAAARFLASLPPQRRPAAQTEVHRFVQWCSRDRPVASLTPLEVANYAETKSGETNASQRLEPVRAFLRFASKQGLTPASLASHLRLRKASPRARAASQSLSQAAVTITPEGRQAIQREMEALREQRPHLAAEIKRAAADKDFRENAPLEAAREELGRVESRIRELEALLRGAVESGPAPSQRAGMSSSVHLRDVDTGEELECTLVGPGEVDPGRGCISVNSPVGRAVAGHASGEVVEVITPGGRCRYLILSVANER